MFFALALCLGWEMRVDFASDGVVFKFILILLRGWCQDIRPAKTALGYPSMLALRT